MLGLYSSYNIYPLTMFGSAIALLTMGVIIAFIKVPGKEQYKKVRRIGTGLVVCFLSLSLFSLLNADTGYTEEMDYMSLLVGSLQAAALTWVMVALICPDKLRWGFFGVQGIITALLAVAIGLIYIDTPAMDLIVRVASGLLYGWQCFLCMRLFNASYRTALERLEDAYDDWMTYRLRWSRWGFYCGLAVGIVAYVVIGMGESASIAFVVAYMAYYVLLTIVFIQYVNRLHFYEPIIMSPAPAQKQKTEVTDTLGTALDGWVERKGYCEEETTADIAMAMNVSIEQLRKFVKDTYGDDFRTWRTGLRIGEACRMIDENPEMTMTQIGEAVGIPNRGNFHLYFTRFAGKTPMQYRGER
mgnify:CR=1 FL=1